VYETWSLTLRFMRAFENKVLGRVFGLQREREREEVHNKELHNLHSSLNIIRVMKSRNMRRAGCIARL